MEKKVIIIGGGVAGLSSGIYGQLNGYSTEILEMHSLPGGQCTAWKRKDYTFDYCIHWLVGSSSGPFHDIWKETGALDEHTEIWDPDTFVTMRMPDGEDFIVYADVDRWEQYLIDFAPVDIIPIARMCNDMRKMSTMHLFEDPAFRRGLLDYARFMINSGPAVRLFMKYGKMPLDGKYITPKIEKAFAEWPLFKPIVQVSFGISRPIESEFHTYQVIAPGETIGRTTLATSYGVSNYNHDPEITPEGKCVMKMLFDSPIELWEDLKEEEYRAEKQKIASDAMEKLEKLYPDVKGCIEVVDVATPLTDIRYTGVWRGAYEGFLPTSKNMTKTLSNKLKGLENFYMAGQWLFPGGGLPPSAQSGKWLFQEITKKDKKKFRVE